MKGTFNKMRRTVREIQGIRSLIMKEDQYMLVDNGHDSYPSTQERVARVDSDRSFIL